MLAHKQNLKYLLTSLVQQLQYAGDYVGNGLQKVARLVCFAWVMPLTATGVGLDGPLVWHSRAFVRLLELSICPFKYWILLYPCFIKLALPLWENFYFLASIYWSADYLLSSWAHTSVKYIGLGTTYIAWFNYPRNLNGEDLWLSGKNISSHIWWAKSIYVHLKSLWIVVLQSLLLMCLHDCALV